MILGQSTGRAALGRPVLAARLHGLHRTGIHLVGVPDQGQASPSHHHIDLTGCSQSASAFRPSFNRGLLTSTAAVANGNGSSAQYDYDLFTIGAGSGGVRASRISAGYGAKVAVCELPFDYKSSDTKGGIGGTCVLRGCVPKKLMVYASEYATHFHDSVGFGWEQREMPKHDWGKFMAAKRKDLMRLNGAYTNTLNNAKVQHMEGRGKVLDPHTVEVDGKRYTARNILIAVGGRPTKIKLPGAEHAITSDDILELDARPEKLAIIGGGYIGVEFAGIFNRFGTEVHVVYRQDRPLGMFDDEIRTFITEQYETAGLNLHPCMTPKEIRKEADGKLTLVIAGKDGKEIELKGNDQVLMATGRGPNTRNLGLEEAGVKLGKKGEVLVDEYSRTNVPSIWAVGDVTNRVQLTPVALMEGMALAKTIVHNEPTKPDYWAIPSAVFSYPEMSTVGMTEAQALDGGHKDLDIFTTSFKPMRNTLSGCPLKVFIKIIVDANSRKLLGVHMVGDHAAEIMQGIAVAVKMGVTKEQLDSVVGIHPSAAEELVTMRSVSRKVRAGALVTA